MLRVKQLFRFHLKTKVTPVQKYNYGGVWTLQSNTMNLSDKWRPKFTWRLFSARCEESISTAIQRWREQSRPHFWAPPGDGRLDDPGQTTTAHCKPLALTRKCKSKMTEGLFVHWKVIDWIFSSCHCVSWQTSVTPICLGKVLQSASAGAARRSPGTNWGERRDDGLEGGM